jgi:hypothetical protein
MPFASLDATSPRFKTARRTLKWCGAVWMDIHISLGVFISIIPCMAHGVLATILSFGQITSPGHCLELVRGKWCVGCSFLTDSSRPS